MFSIVEKGRSDINQMSVYPLEPRSAIACFLPQVKLRLGMLSDIIYELIKISFLSFLIGQLGQAIQIASAI